MTLSRAALASLIACTACTGLSSDPQAGELVLSIDSPDAIYEYDGDAYIFTRMGDESQIVTPDGRVVYRTPGVIEGVTSAGLSTDTDVQRPAFWAETNGGLGWRVMRMDSPGVVNEVGTIEGFSYILNRPAVDAASIYIPTSTGAVWRFPREGGAGVVFYQGTRSTVAVAAADDGVWVTTTTGLRLIPRDGEPSTDYSLADYGYGVPDELSWPGTLFGTIAGTGVRDGAVVDLGHGAPRLTQSGMVLPFSPVADGSESYFATGNDEAYLFRATFDNSDYFQGSEALVHGDSGHQPACVTVGKEWIYWCYPNLREVRRLPR
ncbi:MAG TPA: hypothetical protein VGM90_02100 [Kofleriaceae bacterium]